MRNELLLVGTMLLSLATAAPAKAEALKLNAKRLVEIIDVIDGSQLSAAQVIAGMAAESKEGIDILINSPGGSVMIGYMIADSIDAARSRGIKVRCATGILAASMGFNLLAHCTEVYALPHAALLFHPPRVMTREALTVPTLLKAAEDLQRIIDSTSGELQNMMGLNNEQFQHHFNAETLWTASDLAEASPHKWLHIVDSITGSKQVFSAERPRSLADLFGRQGGTFGVDDATNKPYTIILVSPRPNDFTVEDSHDR